MAKLIAIAIAIAACKHDAAAPPSLLQDGSPAAPLDAAPAAAPRDAAIAAVAPTAVKVVVGAHAACAVMSDHSVRCWGGNDNGQLGDGTRKSSAAAVAPAIRGVQDLVLGADHACALLDDASVACWGKIGFGPKPGPTLVPTGVVGVHDMVRVFAIGGASSATAKAGPLVCWGDVDARGHVTATGAHRTPTPVPGIDRVAVLAKHAAVRDDGSVAVWLDNGAPAHAEITGATELASAADVVCVLDGSGDVRCVGPGAPCAAPPPTPAPPPAINKHRGHGPRKAGRLAKPTPTPPPPPPTPTPDVPPTLAFHTKVLHLALDAGTCVVNAAKQLVCLDETCKLVRPWPALVGVVETGGTCARLANGTVRCGDRGGGAGQAAPAITGVAGATQLSVVGTRACAVLGGSGSVACWDTGTVSTKTTYSAEVIDLVGARKPDVN